MDLRPPGRFGLIAALALTLVGCGQSVAAPAPSHSSSATPASQSLSGPGVSVTLPSGWLDLTKEEGKVAHLNPAVENVVFMQPHASRNDYIWILRQPLRAFPSAPSSNSGPTLQDEATYNFGVESKTTGCDGPRNVTDNNVNGEPAKVADFICSSQAERVVVTAHGDYAYLVYFVSDRSTIDANLKDFAAVMDSWRWSS